jgi:hypothetical protein
MMFGVECELRPFSSCRFLQFPLTSPYLAPSIFLNAVFSNSACVHPLTWEIEFHTHINNKCNYKTTNSTRRNNYKRNLTEPSYMVRPCSENGRRRITQNSIEVDTETKESTRKTEEKLDGRYKEGHEQKKPK